MAIDHKTLEVLPLDIIKDRRILVIDNQPECLTIATDEEKANIHTADMLQFILNRKKVEVKSIMDFPNRAQDFADTIQYAETAPRPPDRIIGCDCADDM